jgi:NADPH:quinone reductase-like Zn-dependent oxidoreductase
MPKDISYQQAAASLEGAHYAYCSLKKLDIKPGQSVLINGATGAIGTALLQFLQGYDVTTTAVGSSENLELLQKLGADRVIDYTKMDIIDDSEQYDVIFDMVGQFSFKQFKQILKPKGIFGSSELGPKCQYVLLAILTLFSKKQRVVFAIPANIPESIAFITTQINQKKFIPVIDTTYPLADITKAYTYVAKGFKTGNVVIIM